MPGERNQQEGRSRFLAERYAGIVSSLSCDVTAEDYRAIGPRVESLAAMARIENRAVALYDINERRFILKLDDHLKILGYGEGSPGGAGISSSAEDYHAMIHGDDLPFLYDTEIKTFDFLRGIPGAGKKDYKLVYDYRVRASDGRYVRFLHQLAPFELDRNGNSWILLVISDVLSSFPLDEKPRRFVINVRTGRICLFGDEIGSRSTLLTAREREILTLASEGFDSRAIADRLCVSVSTVNNHRQNVLRKTGSRNLTQAIAYCSCVGAL